MSVNLFVNNIMLTQFSKVVIDKSLTDFTGSFHFDVVDSDQFNIEKSDQFPIKVGAECKIYIDNELIISGFIDKISGSYSSNSHMLHVSGRDKTSDIVDSHIGGDLNFSSDISLTQIIERVIAHLQIFDIKVVSLVDDITPFSRSELDLISVKPCMNAFDFIEMYARKKQVLLTTDNKGSIIITRGTGEVLPGKILNEFSNPLNNVISARFNYDNSKRYNKYTIRSQQNPATLLDFINNQGQTVSNSTDAKTMSDQSASINDEFIRQGRVFEKISESSSTKKQLEDRATWEANIRRARALTYTPTLQGFRSNGNLGDIWELNKLIQVSDVFSKINALLLINRLTFTLDLNVGSTTTLELVDKDSFELSLQYSKKDKRSRIAPVLIFDPRNP